MSAFFVLLFSGATVMGQQGSVLREPGAADTPCLIEKPHCEALVSFFHERDGAVAKAEFERLIGPVLLEQLQSEQDGDCTTVADVVGPALDDDSLLIDTLPHTIMGFGADGSEIRSGKLKLFARDDGELHCSFLEWRELL
ncbi:MAG: hypothetical protein AAGE76_08580 [Pseudomonadota bacterium]